jgi:hypothetical protein
MGDYVYLQHTMPTTLDVTIGHVILKVKEVLYSRSLILKNK